MKNQTEKSQGGRRSLRGFYTALGCSLAMIGTACYVAYHQTSTTLEENLSSLTQQMEVPESTFSYTTQAPAPVLGVQTDVVRETEPTPETAPVTAPVATTALAAPTEPTESETQPTEAPVHQLVAPLADYRVLQEFSDGELVKSETTGTWQTHNGVDLACAKEAEVYAIDVGVVTAVEKDALWGYTVTLDHENGMVSRYCSLDGALDVKEGDRVQSGQKIGRVGDTADLESALETHLHLEVQKSGSYVDPLSYFA